jgi:hypothetical protein
MLIKIYNTIYENTFYENTFYENYYLINKYLYIIIYLMDNE